VNRVSVASVAVSLVALTLAGFAAPSWAQNDPIIVERAAPPPKPKPTPRPEPVFKKPTLLWKTFLRRVDGTPASAGTVSFIGAGNSLHQLDSGGHTLWAMETGNQQSTPAYDDKRVYIGSDRGILYAFNRKTGQQTWTYPTGQNVTITTQPTTGAGRVYFEATDDNVYAVEAATGTLKWKYTRSDGSLGYSSPTFANDRIYVCGETTLYCLDAETGEEQWKAYLGGKSQGTPVVDGETVYVGGDGTGLSAVNATNGEIRWTFKGKGNDDWFGTPLVAGGLVYVTSYGRYAYALDPAAKGKPKWSYQLLGNSLSQPAYDAKRKVVYVASITFRDNPTLTALNAKTGAKLWDYKMGYVNGSPVIESDRLYIGSTNGYYYAFSLK
jgi:eukaryotic-like serine/threonine-protein kinase